MKSATSNDVAAYDNIKVVVRSRPLNAEEKAANAPSLVTCDQERNQVSVVMTVGSKRSNKRYNYDMVFGQYSTQEEVYRHAIKPVVDEVLLGYNCTVFAYGQTGTGKTHTMEGNVDDPDLQGMIPRAVTSIFESLDNLDSGEYTVKVSFLELYNEELQDLLSVTDEKKLRILDDKSRMSTGVACHNLEEAMVKSPEEIIAIMKKAMAKRQVGETKLNKASSRSHCIFTMTVHMRETTTEGEDLLKVGKLNLVDLAGSECVGRSGATNQRAREAGNINKSLLTLGRVISALVEKTPHVPYRDSKLTRLLQESLGGRAKTCIIATVAPSVQCLDETLSTLEYASRAKSIKNKPEANQRMTKRAMIKEYAEDLERLRQELASARAKDGVFLDETRYNEMVTSIESQKSQIEELEDLLEVRQKEYNELQGQFEDTNDALEQTREELGYTKEDLENTQSELQSTKTELETQITLVEETCVLVKEHQSTEGKLREQAKDLQGTLTVAKDDIGELRAKISRKDALEARNLSTTNEYRHGALESLQSLSDRSAAFLSDQVKHHDKLQVSLAALAGSHAEETKAILTAVAQLSSNATGSIHELTSRHIPQVKDDAVSKLEQVGSLATSQRDTAKGLVSQVQGRTLAPLETLLSKVLVDQETRFKAHTEALRAQLKSQRDQIATFAHSHHAALEALSVKIAADAEDSRRAIESQAQQIEAFVGSERARIESETTAIATQLAGMIDALRTKAQSKLGEMMQSSKSQCASSVEVMIRSEMETKKLVQDAMLTTGAHAKQQTGCIDDLSTKVSETSSDMSSALSNAQSCATEARLSLHEGSSQLSSLVSENHSALEQQCQDGIAHMGDLAAQVAAEGDKMASTIEASTNGAEQLVKSQEAATSKWTEACKAGSGERQTELSSFGSELGRGVVAMQESCNKYVDDDLARDQSTGSTPRAKRYSFDSNIPATRPHNVILEEYREGKARDQIVPAGGNNSELFSDESKYMGDSMDVSTSPPSPPLHSASASEDEDENIPRAEDENDPVNDGKPGARIAANAGRASLSEIGNRIDSSSDDAIPSKPESDIAGVEVNEHDSDLTREAVLAMNCTELRHALTQHNLSRLGNKAALQQRLVDSLAL